MGARLCKAGQARLVEAHHRQDSGIATPTPVGVVLAPVTSVSLLSPSPGRLRLVQECRMLSLPNSLRPVRCVHVAVPARPHPPGPGLVMEDPPRQGRPLAAGPALTAADCSRSTQDEVGSAVAQAHLVLSQ